MSRDHMIKGACNLVSANFLLLVSTLPSLALIGLVEVEMM